MVRFWLDLKKESTRCSDSLEAEHERRCDEQIKADSEDFGLSNWEMEQFWG